VKPGPKVVIDSTRVHPRAQRCELCGEAWQMPGDIFCVSCAGIADEIDDALLAEMDAKEQSEAA
jgi:hypothetical protein